LQSTALITGGARRIGAAIATHLHQAGFRVVIHCHHSCHVAQALMDTLNQCRANSAVVLSADLSVGQSLAQLISDAVHWAGQLDVLVNNASIFSRQDADWDRLFAVNVKAPYELSLAAYPHLVKTQGSIINITDTHARIPLKGYAVYSQTKAALAMQTKALALELAPHVRVNAVAPGAIIWPEGENGLTAEQQQSILSKTLLRRHGHPLFIAKAVLAFIENPFMTGQTTTVDGGRYL